MSKIKRLDEETKAKIREEFKAGASISEVADKYGIAQATASWHRRIALGIPQPPSLRSKTKAGRAAARESSRSVTPVVVRSPDEALEQLNTDILAGQLSDQELRKKYRLAGSSLWRRKIEARRGSMPTMITDEQKDRCVALVGRIAVAHPQIFSDMIVGLVKRHPEILIGAL